MKEKLRFVFCVDWKIFINCKNLRVLFLRVSYNKWIK